METQSHLTLHSSSSFPPSFPPFYLSPFSSFSHTQTLEKHQIELLGRLDEFERLREQLEVSEQLESLNEARDAVRRHVEAKQLLDKSDLDSSCEAVNHTTVKLSPCTNPDFLGW